MLRKLWNCLTTLLVTAVVLLAFLLVGVRLLGLTPYTVLSGSMEPTYHVGSLIYVKPAQPHQVQVGDPITFVVNEDLLVATHRVVNIDIQTTTWQEVTGEDGTTTVQEAPLPEFAYYFYTKGDANDVADGAPVYYKNLIGIPVFTVPYLGYLSSWLQTRKGAILGTTIAIVLVMLLFMPDVLRAVDEPPSKKKKKKGKKSKKRSKADGQPQPNGPVQ